MSKAYLIQAEASESGSRRQSPLSCLVHLVEKAKHWGEMLQEFLASFTKLTMNMSTML